MHADDNRHEYLCVIVSAGSSHEAREMARTVVERRLAACAQMLPMRSIYIWDGKLAEDEEYLILFKTRADRYRALEAAILAQHSYKVPEILALPVVAGSKDYLKWLNETLDGSGSLG